MAPCDTTVGSTSTTDALTNLRLSGVIYEYATAHARPYAAYHRPCVSFATQRFYRKRATANRAVFYLQSS
jgi:hypothetical protein